MDPFSVDHVQPWSAGGATEEQNLAWACLGCNAYKQDSLRAIDPASGSDSVLFNPRKDRWPEHFAWSDDRTRVVGLTPAGRATVHLLRLNREGLLNLRRALTHIGQHPPQEHSR